MLRLCVLLCVEVLSLSFETCYSLCEQSSFTFGHARAGEREAEGVEMAGSKRERERNGTAVPESSRKPSSKMSANLLTRLPQRSAMTPDSAA